MSSMTKGQRETPEKFQRRRDRLSVCLQAANQERYGYMDEGAKGA